MTDYKGLHTLQARTTRYRHSRAKYSLKRNVIRRLALILGVCCTLQIIRLHTLSILALKAKYTATDFSSYTQVLEQQVNTANGLDFTNRSSLLAARPDWRPLGSGWEGSTYAWNGEVVKTFKPEQSPFRNCQLPNERAQSLVRHKSSRWPAEIPATLIFGNDEGFVPVRDVFLADTPPMHELQWHLVTPLMEGGSLHALADNLARSGRNDSKDIRQLDIRYRSSFNRLLRSLGRLHAQGYCHDDVKPGNIFVDAPSDNQSSASWRLGDLGNVRQVAHPYHASSLWTHKNGQLPDCRANDALRAVKTYLQFLRQASAGLSETVVASSPFDRALVAAEEPWARLFRRARGVENQLSVGEVLRWSEGEEGPATSAYSLAMLSQRPRVSLTRSFFLGWQETSDRAATRLLKISASEGWSRLLALTWLFGVPVGGC